MKARYRTKLELYKSILEQCQEELLHSEVCRKCNLSHYDAIRNLEYLRDLGMLQTLKVPAKPEPRDKWKATTYGLECLRKIEETHELFVPPPLITRH